MQEQQQEEGRRGGGVCSSSSSRRREGEKACRNEAHKIQLKARLGFRV